MERGTRAAVYARRSTEEQEASLDRQLGECRKYAERAGLTIVAEYKESASGWKGDPNKRPQFAELMKRARAGAFDVLIVWELSRLSRQGKLRSAVSIVWEFDELGVEVRSVIDPSTGNELADDLMLFFKSHSAKAESDTKSQRVTSGKRQGVARGVHQGRWVPYGYRLAGRMPSPTKSDRMIHRYGLDPERAETVREIFERYLAGESPQQIADVLNERGVDPPARDTNHPRKRRGGPVWHQSTLRELIANPLLAGFATHKGERVKACGCPECDHPWVESLNVPRIIDIEVWERAQSVLEARRRPSARGRGNHSSSSIFLLSGLVWCGQCGDRIGTRTSKSGRHLYICRSRRLGARCDLPTIEQTTLDESVRESFVRQFVDAVDVQATIERERMRLRALRDDEATAAREELGLKKAEVVEVERMMSRAKADYDRGELKAALYDELHTDYRARVEAARKAVGHLEAAVAQAERAMSTSEVDALLDQLDSILRMAQGHLTATEVPTLNAQLYEVFEEFRITREGERIIVEPRLRPEWVPEGRWRVLDFGEPDQAGVEVVEHVGAVMRKVDLTRDLEHHKINGSS